MLMTKRKPATIGEILVEEFMKPIGLTQGALAEAMGVQRKHVNELCNDRRNVTAATALILARVFGNSPDFWLNVQRRSDLWEAMHSPRCRGARHAAAVRGRARSIRSRSRGECIASQRSLRRCTFSQKSGLLPNTRARISAVGAVTLRRSLHSSLTCLRCTPIASASAPCVSPIGAMNSSIRISPRLAGLRFVVNMVYLTNTHC